MSPIPSSTWNVVVTLGRRTVSMIDRNSWGAPSGRQASGRGTSRASAPTAHRCRGVRSTARCRSSGCRAPVHSAAAGPSATGSAKASRNASALMRRWARSTRTGVRPIRRRPTLQIRRRPVHWHVRRGGCRPDQSARLARLPWLRRDMRLRADDGRSMRRVSLDRSSPGAVPHAGDNSLPA